MTDRRFSKHNTANLFNRYVLHHSQEEVETNENDAVFSYFLSPTFDFKQEILSHGGGIEVLAPEWFREEVMESVREMSGYYS